MMRYRWALLCVLQFMEDVEKYAGLQTRQPPRKNSVSPAPGAWYEKSVLRYDREVPRASSRVAGWRDSHGVYCGFQGGTASLRLVSGPSVFRVCDLGPPGGARFLCLFYN